MKKLMTKKNNTYIAMVIDRSGSMDSIRTPTIEGLNTFIRQQKEDPDGTRLTYAQFDDVYEVVHDNVPISEMPILGHKDFVPRGMTALMDAIGQTINRVSTHIATQLTVDQPNKVIIVIVTDGHENSSTKFNKSSIHELITDKQTHHDWQFIFLAANQNAITTGRSYGVAAGGSMNYSAGTIGVRKVFTAAAGQSRNYAAGLTSKVDFTPQERYCSTADSSSAQEAALQQYADANGLSLADVQKQVSQQQTGQKT